MLSRAHVGVGVTAALVLLHPTTAMGVVATTAGAAVGSLICDIDIRSSDRARDAFRGRMAVLVLVSALLAYDYTHGGGVCAYLVAHLGLPMLSGVTGFVATCVVGALMPHRTFAHSLLALALWSVSLQPVCPALVAPFAIGTASHILLDLTNHTGIQLFWPLRVRASLGLWRSSGHVNDLLALVGTVAAALLFMVLLYVSTTAGVA